MKSEVNEIKYWDSEQSKISITVLTNNEVLNYYKHPNGFQRNNDQLDKNHPIAVAFEEVERAIKNFQKAHDTLAQDRLLREGFVTIAGENFHAKWYEYDKWNGGQNIFVEQQTGVKIVEHLAKLGSDLGKLEAHQQENKNKETYGLYRIESIMAEPKWWIGKD